MIDFSKLFIDTTPLIYYVEKNPEYYDILKKFFMESYNAEKEFVSSVVTVHEYSVHPYVNDEVGLLIDFLKIQMQPFTILTAESQTRQRELEQNTNVLKVWIVYNLQRLVYLVVIFS